MKTRSRRCGACAGLALGVILLAATAGAAPSSAAADSVETLASRLLPVVESYRGLRFLRPVPVAVVNDSVARVHFAARMARFYPEKELAAEALVYEHLGLLEPGTDLPNLLLGVLEEQAGGYYDPDTETFYVLGDVPASLLEIVLVHELTHALDDQHFDVDSTFAALGRDEDRQSAFGAVVEGSGTQVMAGYVMEALAAGSLGVEALLELQESGFGQTERLATAPPVVRCALLAPYVLGEAFLSAGVPAPSGDTTSAEKAAAAALPGPAGAAAIDRAFRDPPVSTEQILHPEKYWRASTRDVPRALPQADFGALFGPGWRRESTGVLGEVLLALLTGSEGPALDKLALEGSESWTNPGAAGWGNDRWELWTDGDEHRTVLVTSWDTEDDAAEFEASLRVPVARVARRGDIVVVVAGPGEDGDPENRAAACLELLAGRPGWR